jgi:hypothetical protein
VANPWITRTGPDTAHGRRYVIDLLDQKRAGTARPTSRGGGDNPLLSLGMCEDDYRKVDGIWKFSTIRLPYFWADSSAKKLTNQPRA